MIYFKSKVIYQDEDILSFQTPSDLLDQQVEFPSIMYDRSDDVEIHGLKISQDMVKEVLARQHKECEVEQVDFTEIVKILATCRFSREIDEYCKNNIDTEYPQIEQKRIVELKEESKEKISMQAFIDECEKKCGEIKRNLGLTQ